MTEDECNEVINIISMHDRLLHSFNSLSNSDQNEIGIENIKFIGFDGNNETSYYSYTNYFIKDLNRFSQVAELNSNYFNSHMELLPKYRRMLKVFNQEKTDEMPCLDKDGILLVIKA